MVFRWEGIRRILYVCSDFFGVKVCRKYSERGVPINNMVVNSLIGEEIVYFRFFNLFLTIKYE